MKVIQGVFANMDILKTPKSIVCTYLNTPEGMIPLENPIISDEHKCQWCNGNEHITVFADPSKGDDKTWICLNLNCVVYTAKKKVREYQPTTQTKRAQEWAEFCEIHDIGEAFHKVTFETIDRKKPEDIEFMRQFGIVPSGIVLILGNVGPGKTHFALGVCELYTRTNNSVIFKTSREVSYEWLDASKNQQQLQYYNNFKMCELLVIDDFGTAEPTAAFLSFFMDVINNRMQFSRKGTILTTSLNLQGLSNICGDALFDRISTGRLIQLNGKSRRGEKND